MIFAAMKRPLEQGRPIPGDSLFLGADATKPSVHSGASLGPSLAAGQGKSCGVSAVLKGPYEV